MVGPQKVISENNSQNLIKFPQIITFSLRYKARRTYFQSMYWINIYLREYSKSRYHQLKFVQVRIARSEEVSEVLNFMLSLTLYDVTFHCFIAIKFWKFRKLKYIHLNCYVRCVSNIVISERPVLFIED